MIRCHLDHRAAGQEWIELRRPVGQLEASSICDVVAVIAEAEQAAVRGYHVAGFVSYDAAPAFDPAFRVPSRAPGRDGVVLPMAWFGVFADSVSGSLPPSCQAPVESSLASWGCEIDADVHAGALRSIRDAIAEGNAYLVNYTSRFRRRWGAADDPVALYHQLAASYGSGYHAYIETDTWAVACGSPELFFHLGVDGRITTRPMKGTAPRGRWSLDDIAQAEALRTSPKERAENVMVVDLLRNDLGRIAVPGGVEVPSLFRLEQHPALWQVTSTVTATLAGDVGLSGVFGALFPSASVTGAPKIAAMSTIADLERSPRGIYCGAIGVLEPQAASRGHPRARFAVAIRTAAVDKVRGLAEYGSGGGITWDSAAADEWAEVQLKARALLGRPTTTLGPEDGLVETMAFVPDDDGGSVRHLADHLGRLAASARYFDLRLPQDTDHAVAEALRGVSAPSRVRIVLRAGGAMEIDTSELTPATPTSNLWLCVDPEPVIASEVTLFHKTTRRARYDERLRRHPGADDVVLVNERGEATETARANIAALLDGRWCTPPLDCGLLPGIERGRSLADGRLEERVIAADDLRRAAALATLSSLRGWRDARLHPACPC